jgi:hypothetical protein
VTVVRFDAVVWNGGEHCDLNGLWLVMLEFAKDRYLGVDPHENMCRHVSGMEWLAY